MCLKMCVRTRPYVGWISPPSSSSPSSSSRSSSLSSSQSQLASPSLLLLTCFSHGRRHTTTLKATKCALPQTVTIPSNQWHFTQIYFHYYFTHSSSIFSIFLFWSSVFCHQIYDFRFYSLSFCNNSFKCSSVSDISGTAYRSWDRSTNEIDAHTQTSTFKP